MKARNRWATSLLPLLVGSVATTGCSSESPSNSKGDGPDDPVVLELINLTVDADRDGLLTAADDVGEDVWTVDVGAAFLANVDDDNLDGIGDVHDAFISDPADTLDLARIRVEAWPDAPEGALGYVTLDELALRHVKLHRLNPADGSWVMVAGSDGGCGATVHIEDNQSRKSTVDPNCAYWNHVVELSAADLHSGVEFGIESKRFPGQISAHSFDSVLQQEVPWNGIVQIELTVIENGVPIASETNPGGNDIVQMRVAPWLNFGNLSDNIDWLYANNFDNKFTGGIQTAADAAQVNFATGGWTNQWAEDYFQTGFTSIPAPDGAVHGMRVAMPRPFGVTNSVTQLPWYFLMQNHLGPDLGAIEVYRNAPSGTSYDSHGNHDLVPPFEGYPYGRIIHGSGVLQETQDFYAAQLVQGPQIMVDTSWLIVGHIDEALSYVPANTDRGWKLLVSSPDLMVSMLEQWQADGNGSAVFHQGKFWESGGGNPADITIDEMLADEDIMSASQNAQAEIDGIIATLKAEVGLTDDEIIEIPNLFEFFSGAHVAYNPGTVNSLVFGDYIVMPDPFGGDIDGVDGMKQDLLDRLGTPVNGLGSDGQGMNVYFTDDWDLYHRLLGEVHCGTNQSGPPQPEVKWWEVMQ